MLKGAERMRAKGMANYSKLNPWDIEIIDWSP